MAYNLCCAICLPASFASLPSFLFHYDGCFDSAITFSIASLSGSMQQPSSLRLRLIQ